MPFLKKFQRGFTLIEMLVALTILAIATTSTLLFLTNILKGSNQSNITQEVKQNGQVVLDSLERQIRNGRDANNIDSNSIQIVIDDNNSFYIRCFPTAALANGYIGAVTKSSSPALSDYVPVTNNNPAHPEAGIDVASCTLRVDKNASPPVVTIKFTMNQGLGAPSRQDFQANVAFQDTISLRNYK